MFLVKMPDYLIDEISKALIKQELRKINPTPVKIKDYRYWAKWAKKRKEKLLKRKKEEKELRQELKKKINLELIK